MREMKVCQSRYSEWKMILWRGSNQTTRTLFINRIHTQRLISFTAVSLVLIHTDVSIRMILDESISDWVS